MTRLVEDWPDICRAQFGKLRIERQPLRRQDVIAKAVESFQPTLTYKRPQLALEIADDQIASSGEEAIGLLETFIPVIILLDLGLRNMPGIELAHIIRRHDSLAKTRIIVLTEHDDESRRAADGIGIDPYRVKPVSIEMLYEVFEERLRH